MQQTHVFELVSGVECEVKELLAKHQRMLTEQNGKNLYENLTDVLCDVIIRIGSVKQITREFIDTLLSEDRKLILWEVRKFSMGDETFEFSYDYLDKDNNNQSYQVIVDLSEPLKLKRITVIEDGKVVEKKFKEYSEVIKEHKLILPRSQKEVTFCISDGRSDKYAMGMSKKDRSSHTPIAIRFPKEYVESKNGNKVPINLDLDKLSLKDIEYLRATIKEIEPFVDTTITFEHPDSELKSATDKNIKIDLLSVVAFFYPSEAI